MGEAMRTKDDRFDENPVDYCAAAYKVKDEPVCDRLDRRSRSRTRTAHIGTTPRSVNTVVVTARPAHAGWLAPRKMGCTSELNFVIKLAARPSTIMLKRRTIAIRRSGQRKKIVQFPTCAHGGTETG